MNDQAELLRKLVEGSATPSAAHETTVGPPVPTVPSRPWRIAIAAGKGGVGTSTVALNVAVALAQAGHRVVLADCDFLGGDAAQLCRLAPGYSIADVLAARRTVHEVFQRGPSGVQVLPGVWAEGEPTDVTPAAIDRLLAQLDSLTAHSEFVVIDVGAAITRPARRFWQAADEVLLVTTPEPVAVMNTYAAVKVLMAGRSLATVKLLVNQTSEPTVAADVHQRLARTCQRFLGQSLEFAGQLPPADRCGPVFMRDDAAGRAATALDGVAQALADALLRRRDAGTRLPFDDDSPNA